MRISKVADWASIGCACLYLVTTLVQIWPTIKRGGPVLPKISLLFLIIAIIGAGLSRMIPHKNRATTEKEKRAWSKLSKTEVIGKTFANQRVLLDGYAYRDCRFINVTLVCNGEAPFSLIHNTFEGLRLMASDRPGIEGLLLALKELGFMGKELKTIIGDTRSS